MAMAVETTGSTVPRRQLGRYLRELRGSQRITVKSAAEKLEWSEAKIWRIETGQTSLRSHDVELMCRIYGAPADMTEALTGLAKETKARGWWQAFGDAIPEWFDVYIGLEEAASEISWYESELVPGLLQTEEYARTLIEADNPGVDEEEIGRRVQVRVQRQALVRRATAPLKLRVVLNEGILHRPVGGPEVMAAQLDRLAEAGDWPTCRCAWSRSAPVSTSACSRGRSRSCASRRTATASRASPQPSTRTASPEPCTWTSLTRSSATRGVRQHHQRLA